MTSSTGERKRSRLGESATGALNTLRPESRLEPEEGFPITKPEHLAQWYLTQARLDPRRGGTIDYLSGPARLHVTGKILAWEPPRVFEHEWNVEPRKDLPKGERSIVRWELTPVGDTTLLRFSHRRLTRQTAVVFAGGMHAFLDRLEDQLEGRPLGNWLARVGEVRSEYPQWGSGGGGER